MKKQFLLAMLIIILGVCFCSLTGDNLQACDTDAANCSVNVTRCVKSNPVKFTVPVEDAGLPFDAFMNPFIHL